MSDFVHLRLRTAFSVDCSVVRIEPLFDSLSTRQTESVAMTDVNNMFAAFSFSDAAVKKQVKPIIGSDLMVRLDSHQCSGLVTVLVTNRVGYGNLCRLLSDCYQTRAESSRQEIDLPIETLIQHQEGLIVLSAGQQGLIGQLLNNDRYEQAEQCVKTLSSHFDGRFYLSIERIWQDEIEQQHIGFCTEMVERHSLPLVATNNVLFLAQEDFRAQIIRAAIHQNINADDQQLKRLYSDQQYLKTTEQMVELFSDIPAAISNTVELARRCNFFLVRSQRAFLPSLVRSEEKTSDQFLVERANQQLKKYIKQNKFTTSEKKIYQKRLDRELEIIVKMGFSDYFLIVDEFVNWARQNDVMVGPGRGSGPGSLVAYMLEITRIDPIRYDLLFERFLNPERVSLPDFDIDFDDQERDKVIAHVSNLYGKDKVAQIITFGTMAARAVVRDVGRVLGRPLGLVDRLAKMIPFSLDMTLDKALQSSEFKQAYRDPEVKEIVDAAREIEGLPRNAGRHAGGVVIAPDRLSHFCALYQDEEGVVITQFDKNDLEAIGLVKYDFLGLRVLSTIRTAVANIEQQEGQRIAIEDIDLQDKKTLRLINSRETLGVFQLESAGMRELIHKLKPDKFADIVALVALFRPATMKADIHDKYCDRKHGREKITFYHAKLKPVLQPTYGLFIYQEQAMEAVRVLAGFSPGEADLLRRAIGKKDTVAIEKHKPTYIEGCEKNDISHQVANEVFELLSHFGDYGFNKSHSVSYGLLAFQTAWLKSHYPTAYMASLMTHEPNQTDIARMVRDCKRMKIKVLPPNVNKSNVAFKVIDQHQILYGLGSIKSVGRGGGKDSLVDRMCHEREKNGPYKSMMDFLVRMPLEKMSTKTLTALVASGACDDFCQDSNRLTLIEAIERSILQAAQAKQQALVDGQSGLFDAGDGGASPDASASFDFQPQPDNPRQELEWEWGALSLYLGDHRVGLVRRSSQQLNGLPRLAALKNLSSEKVHCLFEIRDVATAKKGNHLTISADDEDTNLILYFPQNRRDSTRSPWGCKGKIVLAEIQFQRGQAHIMNLYLESDMYVRFCQTLVVRLAECSAQEGKKVLTELKKALVQPDKAAVQENPPVAGVGRGRTKLEVNYQAEGLIGRFRFSDTFTLQEQSIDYITTHPLLSVASLHYDFNARSGSTHR